VPKQLTDEDKLACVEMCTRFLQQYHEEGETLLHRVQTSPKLITTFLDLSKMHYMDTNLQKVKDAVHMWLHTQLKTFSADGIMKLMG
jgi:hypothetical protein